MEEIAAVFFTLLLNTPCRVDALMTRWLSRGPLKPGLTQHENFLQLWDLLWEGDFALTITLHRDSTRTGFTWERTVVSLIRDAPSLTLSWADFVPLEHKGLCLFLAHADEFFATRRCTARGTLHFSDFLYDDTLRASVDRVAFITRPILNVLSTLAEGHTGNPADDGALFFACKRFFSRALAEFSQMTHKTPIPPLFAEAARDLEGPVFNLLREHIARSPAASTTPHIDQQTRRFVDALAAGAISI